MAGRGYEYERALPERSATPACPLWELVVTRTTDQTCAKELVIKNPAVRKELPLNKPVTIELTPEKGGEIRYACGMDMISGVLLMD